MWEFCLFEIKYRLKHVSTYVFAGILLSIVTFIYLAAGGAIGGTISNVMGSSDKIYLNGAFFIYTMANVYLVLGIFMMASFINQMFAKDFETRFYDILFCKPIKKYQYILGRLFGNGALMLAIITLCFIVSEVIIRLPSVEQDLFTSAKLMWYIEPLLLAVLPNLYFFGALFIATVIATKKSSAVFGTGVFLYILLVVAESLSSKIDNEVWATIIDPFGSMAYDLAIKGWTAAERNTQTVGLSPYILINRLFWIGISTVILVSCWRMFNFNFAFKGDKKRKVEDDGNRPVSIWKDGNRPVSVWTPFMVSESITPPHTPFTETFRTHFTQFLSLLVSYLQQIYRSPSFYWITLLMLGLLAITLPNASRLYGTETLPVTYLVLDVTRATALIFYLIFTFFSGELIFRDRDHKFNQIKDTLPISPLVNYLSKYIAMAFLVVFFFLVIIATGIVYQAMKGYYHFEIALYFQLLFAEFPYFLILISLAFLIHNFVNQKYLAHFIFVLFVMFMGVLCNILKIEHSLLVPFSLPSVQYSDMAGFGVDIPIKIWMTIYWGLITLLLTVITIYNWKSGLQQRYTRAYIAKLKTKPTLILHCTIIALILLSAGYIFYNTNIRHTYRNSKQREKLYVQYEKSYKHFQKANQPKIQDVKVNIELFPETQEMHAIGSYLLKNVGDTPVDTLFVGFIASIENKISVETPLMMSEIKNQCTVTLIKHDPILGYNIYKINPSLAPQDSLMLNFTTSYSPKGFSDTGSDSSFPKNGTFFTNKYFPSIGYNSGNEVYSQRRRKKLDLPEQAIMPDTSDPWGLSHNYVSNDADWISYEVSVSTSADQIALAPGERQDHWTENGRNHYIYKLDKNAVHFYAILSARYEVERDNHNGIDLEIYYHEGHDYNIEAMMYGLRAALDYYQKHFGPYPHSILRIAEFPRYAAYAQAFPTLIPFSESVGFIANLKQGTIEYPVYVTAHETAHQWWAHQVIGGFVRGTTMLSESFAEYSAIMVVKDEYGDKLYREQLRYTLNEYLSGRSNEQKYELPLVKVENQLYLHYKKGMLVLNTVSRLLGEDVVNKVLQEFLEKTKYTANPYTNSLQFMQTLDPYVPDSLKTTIEDLFEKIVIYEHKVESVSTVTTDDFFYKTTLKFTSEKRYYDEKGNPEIVPFIDWLEIGLLDSEKKIIHLETVYVSEKENTIEIVSAKSPDTVYLDPYIRYIDLAPQNNSQGGKSKGSSFVSVEVRHEN